MREEDRQGETENTNNCKVSSVYSFAAFKVVRAYKYFLIMYVYACAFKRERGEGLEKLMNHIT